EDLKEARRKGHLEEYVSLAGNFVRSASEILGESSPQLADALEIAGDLCMEASELTEAERYYLRAYELARENKNYEQGGRVAGKLGQIFERLDEYGKAAEQCRLALQNYEEAGVHSNHPTLLNQLGGLLRRMGANEEACKAYREAVENASQIYGPKHESLAILYNNLGVALMDMGEFVQAENNHLQALAIRESNYGASHPETAHSLANLGALYYSWGDRDKALRHFQAALEIYRKYYSPTSNEIVTLQGWLDFLEGGPT
ncbi:MAG: tetratricopeptide repeat protein, partial [Chthoniobacterales bacterium]|nr:tetratricopeptide repeat protein [Chthoniobacterales bacterium]